VKLFSYICQSFELLFYFVPSKECQRTSVANLAFLC